MRKEKCERGGMAYTVDLESTINQDIWVQIPSLAPFENYKNFCYNIYRKLRETKEKRHIQYRNSNIVTSPSGKAQVFETCMQRFESSRHNHKVVSRTHLNRLRMGEWL